MCKKHAKIMRNFYACKIFENFFLFFSQIIHIVGNITMFLSLFAHSANIRFATSATFAPEIKD